MLAAHRRRQIVELVESRGLARASDLATEFGVTRMTINRDLEALSQQGLIDKVYGGAVAVRDEVPQPTPAAGPVAASPRRVAIVVPTDRFYFRTIVRGAQLAFSAAGIDSMVITTGYGPQSDAVDLGDVDGAVVTTPLTGPLQPDLAGDVPIVIMEREVPHDQLLPHSSVASDVERGVRAAVTHLAGLGHERIALLTINRAALAQQMAHAWADQLTIADLPSMPWVVPDTHPLSPAEDPNAIDAAFTEIAEAHATAVIAFNDLAAATLVRRAEERDCRVPQDLAVVGYGDEVAANVALPITAIAPSKLEIGRLAAATLIERLRDPSLPTRHVLVEPRLIMRSSTGQVTEPKSAAR